jgi:hypothetical protein
MDKWQFPYPNVGVSPHCRSGAGLKVYVSNDKKEKPEQTLGAHRQRVVVALPLVMGSDPNAIGAR